MASVAVMLTMGLRGTATNSAPQRSARRPPSGDDFNIFVLVTCVLCQRVHQVGGSASVFSRRLRLPTLQGRSHETCGGRSLNDDVMDTLYTLLVNPNNGFRIGDGVTRQRRGVRFVLPYPAPPNPTHNNSQRSPRSSTGRPRRRTLTEKPKGDGP
jgi:hypothetical protein